MERCTVRKLHGPRRFDELIGTKMTSTVSRRKTMDRPSLTESTAAWMAFVWISFSLSMSLMCVGIYFLPAEPWIKGYILMGLFFSIGSSFTLSKTVRDNHESRKLINRVTEVKTERMLQDFELKESAR